MLQATINPFTTVLLMTLNCCYDVKQLHKCHYKTCITTMKQ